MGFDIKNSVRYRQEQAARAAAEAPPPIDPEVERIAKLAENAKRHLAEAKQRAERERAIERGRLLIEEILLHASPAERQVVIQNVMANPDLSEEAKLALDGTANAYSDELDAVRESGEVPRYFPSRDSRGQFAKR